MYHEDKYHFDIETSSCDLFQYVTVCIRRQLAPDSDNAARAKMLRKASGGFTCPKGCFSACLSISVTVLFLGIGAFNTAANAQSSRSTGTEPGNIEDRIKKSIPRPMPEAAPAIPELPQPNVQPDGLDEKFVLAGVEITGTTVYPIDAFTSIYEEMLASEVRLSDIQDVVKAITKKYRDDGYFLTSAVADPQDLALGVLRIKIIEGKITRVTFNGDLGERKDLHKRFAEKIKTGGPTRLERLERYMMLIDDLPGAAIDGSLKPIDTGKGEFELVLAVTHQSVDGYTSIDNRGIRAIGTYQALLHGNLNKGLTNSERTGITIFTIPRSPKELVYGELTHEQHIGTEGLKVSFALSHSAVDAGGDFAASDLGSSSSRAVLATSYPLIRSRDHNLTLSGKVDVTNQRQNQDDDRIFDDRLRLLRIGADYGFKDDHDGQNALSIELTRGFDILGASSGSFPGKSRAPSRVDGHVEFTKLTASASRRQKIDDVWAMQLSLTGQKSDERLLSAETLYLGGTQFGRAFDSGEISGDDGAGISAEIQYSKFPSKPYLDSYQIYGFYDFGVVWETEATDFNGRATLSSAGGGVRLGFTKSIFGGIEFAKPLTRTVANEGDKGPRVFFYFLVSK